MIAAVFRGTADFLEAIGRAFNERATAFSEYEAGDWLAAGGRMECDGPDATDPLDDPSAATPRAADDSPAAAPPDAAAGHQPFPSTTK